MSVFSLAVKNKTIQGDFSLRGWPPCCVGFSQAMHSPEGRWVGFSSLCLQQESPKNCPGAGGKAAPWYELPKRWWAQECTCTWGRAGTATLPAWLNSVISMGYAYKKEQANVIQSSQRRQFTDLPLLNAAERKKSLMASWSSLWSVAG